MADITVQMGKLDATQSILVSSFTAGTLEATNTIVNALENKNNSLHIVINATGTGNVTIKAGNNYPNAMLGDLAVAVAAGINDIVLVDASRFENRDGSVVIEAGEVAGTIYAIAKEAGVEKVQA